jgi:TPR repeat protein
LLVCRLIGDYIHIMALIDCQKCGATIGSKLSVCPYCEPVERDSESAPSSVSQPFAARESWKGRYTPSLAIIALAFSYVAVLAFAFLVFREPLNTPSPKTDGFRPYFANGDLAEEDEVDIRVVSAAPEARAEAENPVAPQTPSAEERLINLRADASQGDRDAQFELGFAAYPDADRVTDYRESLRWFKAAAERGHLESQKQVGWMHYEGLGVVRDSEEALKWYQMAAKQGDAEAQRAVESLTADHEELARLASVQIELAKLESFLPETGVTNGEGASRNLAAQSIEAEGRSSEPSANDAFRDSPTVRETPSIVFNESNQFITINQQPDPRERDSVNYANNLRYDSRDRFGDYLAASGFFARTRQDAASRAFFERNRQRDRSRPSAARQGSGRAASKQSPFSSQRVSFPRTLGGAPLTTGGPSPLSKAVTPLGSYPKAPWDE